MSQSAWGCGLVVSHKCACSIKQNVSGPTTREVHQCTLGSTTVLMRHRNAGVSSPPAEEADFQVFCHWKQVWAPWFQCHGGSAYRQENFLDKESEGEFSQHLRNPSWGGVCFSSLGIRGCSFPLNVHPESSLSHQADTGRPSTPNNDCSHWVPGLLLTSWPGEHRTDQLGHGQSGAGTCCEGTTRHWPRRWGLWPPDSHSCPWTSPLSFWGSGHEPEHISSCCLWTTSDIHQDHNSCHHPGDFCHRCVQLTLQLYFSSSTAISSRWPRSGYSVVPSPLCKLLQILRDVYANSLQSCWTLCEPRGLQPGRLVGFSRQEYWSGVPLPTPEDLPDPGIEPISLMSPALAGEFFKCVCWEALKQSQASVLVQVT